MAVSWRGPYRLVASDSDARWKGSTANAEVPFLWIDKRGRWHQLVEGNPMPGGHAWSADGTAWSNITLRALGGAEAVRTAAAANSANTGGGVATARGAAAPVSASTGSSAEYARTAAAAATASTGGSADDARSAAAPEVIT